MSDLDDVLFRLIGGWPMVFARWIFGALKWASIGALFHLGWRLVG